jgi:GAF domain-containing protein
MMGLALVVSATNVLGIVAALGVPGTETQNLILAVLTVLFLVAFGLGWTRFYRLGSVILSLGLSFSAYALIAAGSDDPSISLYSTVPLALVIGSALLSLGGQVVLTLANTLATGMLPFLLPDAGMTMVTAGRDAGVFFSLGALLAVITAFRNALERTRLGELRAANRELDEIRVTLEERVAERTRMLARRARYLEATATVARSAALELDVRELLARVVVSISEQFGFYHTGIFFLEPGGEWLVLQAASSEGGRRMLARGHRLQGGQGIVGTAAQQSRYRLALDVGEDAVFFDNPDLPETRSEVALPLQARGEIIGVLDVQSTESQAFSDEDVAALEALADQVAVALSNARLFWEAQQALEAERRAYGEIGVEGWKDLIRARRSLGYRFAGRGVVPVEEGADDGGLASRDGEGLPAISLPIEVLGRKLGTIVAHKPPDAGEWSSQETELMETLADRLSLALDSARLYQETRRREIQERMVSEATARMRETLDMDDVIRSATEEIVRVLDLAAVDLRLTTWADSADGDEGEG